QLVLLAVHRVVGQAEDAFLHQAEDAPAEVQAAIRDAPDQVTAQRLSVRLIEVLQTDEGGAGLLKDVADPLLLGEFGQSQGLFHKWDGVRRVGLAPLLIHPDLAGQLTGAVCSAADAVRGVADQLCRHENPSLYFSDVMGAGYFRSEERRVGRGGRGWWA